MMTLSMFAFAEAGNEQAPVAEVQLQGTIKTLNSLIKLQSELRIDIKDLGGS